MNPFLPTPKRVSALAALLALSIAALAGPRQSSPVALSADNQRLLNVNPDQGTVSLFAVVADKPLKLAEIKVGHDPSSVAIAPDGRAFVANSADGTVSVIDLARRRVTSTFTVGTEPMGLVLTPNGTRLYVANSASNSVSVINTASLLLVATIDLSGVGNSPRALAMTDDGDSDDTDETVFVAAFFGALRPGKTSTQEGEDDQREGRVASIAAATNIILGTTVLGPMANTGFNANGQLAPGNGLTPAVASTNPPTFTTPTGAFPNQLASVATHPTLARAYVVSTGASPNGPLRFNQMAQGLVSVFDVISRVEVTAGQTGAGVRQTAPLNLNQGINLATTPAPRLFMTNPVAMAFRPNGSDAWVAIQNSNVVTRVTFDANGIPTTGAPLVAGPSQVVRVDLQNPPAGLLPGKAPRGIAINNAGTRAYVSNFVSRSISVIDISTPTAPQIVGTGQSTAAPRPGTPEAMVQFGAELFFTGRGTFKVNPSDPLEIPHDTMSSESWGGCIVCHPNGRSDNITWMFDAGPRQTVSLDAMFDPKPQSASATRRLNWTRGHAGSMLVLGRHPQRILNWSAVRDENQDFELNTRGVFGGRGLIDDDRLFLAIGGQSGTDLPFIEQFHSCTGAFTNTNDLARGAELPQLPSPGRRDFGLATLSDDRVFIIGGRNGADSGKLITKGAVLEFNPRTNTLRQRSSTGFTPRHSLGAAAVMTSKGPRIYAIGGYAANGNVVPNPVVEEYNPATDTWRTVASLPQAAAQFGITVAGGVNTADPRELIHVVGGNAGSESSPALVGATFGVQRFQADPAGTGAWTNFNVTGLTTRRNHGAAAALRGTAYRIFVIGGQDAAGTVLDTVEEYTNATVPAAVMSPHTSITVSNVPAPRARFGIASTLSTNQIYVFGGIDGTGAQQSSIVEYTIATNGSVAGPPGIPSGTWVQRASLPSGASDLRVSIPPGVTNLLPVANTGRDARQDSIAAWVAFNVRTADAPVAATDSNAQAGRTLFGTTGLVFPGFRCATCHGGPKWTRSAVDYTVPPSPADNIGLGNENVIGAELRKTSTQPGVFPGVLINVGTFKANAAGGRTNEIRFNGADISQAVAPLGANGFNIPSLLSVHETAPYFYSGLAQTLDQVLDGSQDANGGTRHHFVSNASQRARLIAFLRSIDATTPIFP